MSTYVFYVPTQIGIPTTTFSTTPELNTNTTKQFYMRGSKVKLKVMGSQTQITIRRKKKKRSKYGKSLSSNYTYIYRPARSSFGP